MRYLIVLSLVILCGVPLSLQATERYLPYKEVSAEELLEMLKNKPKLVVVDARGGKAFDNRVIRGAINLSVQSTDADSLAKIIPSKETEIVFYCSNNSCPASGLSAHKAAYLGYKHLYKYPGGFEEWEEKGFPVQELN